MDPKPILPTILLLAAASVAGCMSSSSSTLPVYDSSQVGQVISEQRGTIVDVRDVLIKAPTASAGSSGTGSRIGAATVAGLATGSPIAAAGAIGSVIGGVAGARADDRQGEEITMVMEDGRTLVVVQERGDTPLAIGEHIRVQTGTGSSVYGGATAHVVRESVVTAY
jgi:outer membrane lipoprotein SlyB